MAGCPTPALCLDTYRPRFCDLDAVAKDIERHADAWELEHENTKALSFAILTAIAVVVVIAYFVFR